MLEIGKVNKIKILKITGKGVFLDGEDKGEVFLPLKEAPGKCSEGEEIEVFTHIGSNDKIIATTMKPYATVDQLAYLKVITVDTVGAFLDWGLKKDLFVPFREQKEPMKTGKSYFVYIYFDGKSKRIAASSKINKFKSKQPVDYKDGQEVRLLIEKETDIGYRAIINGTHWGILYNNEVFKRLHRGQEINGFIKKVRNDGKIDLSIHRAGYKKADELTRVIMETLENEGGFLAVNDKSSPKMIYELFGESKSTFKNAIGALYKKKLIVIEKSGIRLVVKNI
ncbi:S1 RNA-binding domain-containing protein [Spirochaetota bacterium]